MNYTKKELRYWSNWAFIVLVSLVLFSGQFGVLSSFHQFVTNPTTEEFQLGLVNATPNKAVEPGLGESELFYSMLISATNFGTLIGGFATGFLVRSVPYWYLFLVTLVSHTISYVLYSLSYQGWLMMISRLLSGVSVGAIITLTFGYCTTSSQAYIEVKKDLGKPTDDKSSFRLRNYLFSALSFGQGVGFVIAAGVNVIFAQSQFVDQFRAIGWFNVALGAASICLLLLMFHGEYKCKKWDQCFRFCPGKRKDPSNRLRLLSLIIILSLFLLSMVERMRFVFLVTLFNPIASDSFGIDERGAAYFVLALSSFRVMGSVLVVVFQRLKISSQAIMLITTISTMLGYLIVTDWQTIPYDPCTEFSPFHHPGITEHINITQQSAFQQVVSQETNIFPKDNSVATSPKLTSINLLSDIDIDRGTGSFSHYLVDFGVNFNCRQANTCACDQLPSRCLRFSVVKGKIVPFDGITKTAQEYFQCTSTFNEKLPVTFCVLLSHMSTTAPSPAKISKLGLLSAEINSIDILPEGMHETAKNNCIQANVSGHQCHWIPYSDIFKKECEDCQPICRSVHQTLTFPQFIIGCGVLLLSTPQFVPIASLLMNQSPEQMQGLVFGTVTAMNSITRAVAPLFLDAAYEGMQKRTFLLTMLLAFLHIPFIIEIIVLYPKLGPKTIEENTEQNTKQDKYKYTKLESESLSE